MKEQKDKLHKRNKHTQNYDFQLLVQHHHELKNHLIINKFGNKSISFSDNNSVKALNTALLKKYYKLNYWDIPDGYLCPPIPGRADYIHYLADLLSLSNKGEIPKGKNIQGLDIGTGANLVYPIIGNAEYHWRFIASDIDKKAVNSAQNIITENPNLQDFITLKLQTNKNAFFDNIIEKNQLIDFTICNPPFHASEAEARKGTARKIKNLTGKKSEEITLNFGGKSHELWCKGGELQFVKNMILESKECANTCFWFTSLVSKEANLKPLYKILKANKPTEIKTIEMAQGNKKSRFIAWTFLSKKQQTIWANMRWK